MGMNSFLTSLLVLSLLCSVSVSLNIHCDADPADSGKKPFPSIPSQFESKVEVNIDENRTSIEIEDFYNGMSRQGAVRFMKNGVRIMNVFIYDLKWSIRIEGDNCKVYYNQSMDAVKHARCLGTSDNGMGVACGASEILFAPSRAGKGAKYIGVVMTERGVPCDQWRVCFPAADPLDTLIFDYWFSAPGWTSSSGKEGVPVMVSVMSNRTQGAGALKHVYNFVDFREGEPRVTMPTDIVCPGVNDPPPQPTLPKRFELGFETVDRMNRSLEETREYYDMDNGLHRVDFISHEEDVPYTGGGLTSDIHHLKTGKSYRINRKKGTCTAFFPKQEVTLIQAGDHFHLRTTRGIMSLFPSKDNMYHGFMSLRDIDADNWRQKRKDYPPGMLGNSTWSWYFTKKDWTTNLGRQIPVHLRVSGAIGKTNTSPPMDLDMHVHIFGFNTEFLSTKTFDLPDSCYADPPVPAKQYSATILAIVGVACSILGLILGCLLLFCVYRRNPGRERPYSMMKM